MRRKLGSINARSLYNSNVIDCIKFHMKSTRMKNFSKLLCSSEITLYYLVFEHIIWICAFFVCLEPFTSVVFLIYCLCVQRSKLNTEKSELLAFQQANCWTILADTSSGISMPRNANFFAGSRGRCWVSRGRALDSAVREVLETRPRMANFRGLILGCIEAKFCK